MNEFTLKDVLPPDPFSAAGFTLHRLRPEDRRALEVVLASNVAIADNRSPNDVWSTALRLTSEPRFRTPTSDIQNYGIWSPATPRSSPSMIGRLQLGLTRGLIEGKPRLFVELGVELHRVYRGHGHGAKITHAVTDHVFSAVPYALVGARIANDNTASRRAAEKIGMVERGVIPGTDGTVLYTLTKADLAKSQARGID